MNEFLFKLRDTPADIDYDSRFLISIYYYVEDALKVVFDLHLVIYIVVKRVLIELLNRNYVSYSN